MVRLYANSNGSLTNTNSLTALTNTYAGDLAWGDGDNDGDLDLLVTGLEGWSSAVAADICRNDHGIFSALGAGWPGAQHSATAWGDYDNDGDLDVLLAGQDANSNLLTRIYRNDRFAFAEIDARLPGLWPGTATWADWDNDGDLDLLLTGSTNGTASGKFTALFRNDRAVFIEVTSALPPLWRSSAAFGDYDQDGDLDLLLSGNDGSTNQCHLYRNDNALFTDVRLRLPCTAGSLVAWVDYDNDGDLDIHVPGHIYRNDVSGFVEQHLDAMLAGGEPWADGYPSAPAWGDDDGDGDLDVLISWREPTWAFYLPNTLYRNNAILSNSPPTPPSGLRAATVGTGVILEWLAASDAQTPSRGLTYNVRAGTTPGGTQLVAPQSDPVTGRRHLPHLGNAQHRLFAVLTNLAVGTYYWSVQSVDTAFGASPFADESTFVITSGPPVAATLAVSNALCCSATLQGWVIAGGLEAVAWFEWGLTTNYGNATPPQPIERGVVPRAFSSVIDGLQPRTLYHYRAVATNFEGMVQGSNQAFLTEVPIPLVSTLAASNVTHTQATLFGTVNRLGAPTTIFFDWGITTQYGQRATSVVSAALEFDGDNDRTSVGTGRFPLVTNTFTMELWAKPSSWRDPTPESTVGYWGDWAQRHAIFPDKGELAYGSRDHAGVGISVGTNGVTVFEYAYNDGYSRRFNSPLVFTQALAGWIHLAVVYTNQTPYLYVNGSRVRTGLTSPKIVHPSANLGGTDEPLGYHQGYYPGALDEIRVWSTALNAATIQQWMNRELTAEHPDYQSLEGYWPLNDSRGTTANDLSPNGNSAQLLNGLAWVEGWPFGDTLFSIVLEGLLPGVTYYFRAGAVNPGGAAFGGDQTLTTATLARVLGLEPESGRGWCLRFSGIPGNGYTLEASTNLVFWTALTNLLAGADGLFDYLDLSATNFPTRFYRLKGP